MSPLRFENPWLEYGLPAGVGLALFLILGFAQFSRIPAIQDLHRSQAQGNYRIELDGVRGVAALLVLLEHTWAPFLGAGRTGVWLFFILSGYLLSQPFVHRPELALDVRFLGRYYLRRLARILPMYWLTVLLLFGFNGHYDRLPGNLLLLTADGHLWTIPQEVFFYLILPFVMLGAYLLARLHPRASALGVLVVTWLLLAYPSLLPVELYAMGKLARPFTGWFMLGILIAYLNPGGARMQAWLSPGIRRVLEWLALIMLIAILGLSVHGVGPQLLDLQESLVMPMYYGVEFGVACAILLYLVLALPGSWASKLLSWRAFRTVGIVGYSYYLLHPIVISLIRGVHQYYFPGDMLVGAPLALWTGVLTWLAAMGTYSLIERPFIRAAARRR